MDDYDFVGKRQEIKKLAMNIGNWIKQFYETGEGSFSKISYYRVKLEEAKQDLLKHLIPDEPCWDKDCMYHAYTKCEECGRIHNNKIVENPVEAIREIANQHASVINDSIKVIDSLIDKPFLLFNYIKRLLEVNNLPVDNAIVEKIAGAVIDLCFIING